MKNIFILIVFAFVMFSCDNDDSVTPVSDPLVVAELRPNLSELNIYVGLLNELNISSRAFEYNLNTPAKINSITRKYKYAI